MIGFAAAATLVVGAAIGSFAHLSDRTVDLVMGFGTDALISAVSFSSSRRRSAAAAPRS